MVLTLAQHLRQAMPDYCPLIGVFPMAGITALGPGGADTTSIWANTDAALREIDYCQRVAGTPENELTPFFQWPGEGNILFGKSRPFEYAYLFGRENQSGQSLATFGEYVGLIAETLVAESFSNLLDEGFQTAIKGPHSQFIMHLQAKPEVAGRPTTYASAAIGALVYPAERIERHLARRYAMAVLERMTQTDTQRANAAVDEFTKLHALVWAGLPPLQTELTKPLEQADGTRKPCPQPPDNLNRERNQQYAKADRSATVSAANRERETLEQFAGRGYLAHLKNRRKVIVADYADPERGLRKFVNDSLASGGATALGSTHEAVRQIRMTLEREWRALNEAIEGNDDPASPRKGLKEIAADHQAGWDNAVRKLGNGVGGGFGKLVGRNGKEAKDKFYRQTWAPFKDDLLKLERAVQGRETYQRLLEETLKVERALKDLIDQTAHLRDELERSTRTDVGEHGHSGVLDLAVLDSPALVAHRFDDVLDRIVREGVDRCAIAVTAGAAAADDGDDDEGPLAIDEAPDVVVRALPKTGIVAELLARRLDPKAGAVGLLHETFRDRLRDAIVDDGISQLGREVRALSIWEALAAECRARQALELHDAAVSQAMHQVQQQRRGAEQAGVPPKDWEQEVLRAFIRNRLFECQKRVRPFWNLDGLMTANHGAPYGFIVAAADEQAYHEAETTLGLKGVLEQTAAMMQAGAPKWLPGRDRIALYAREGVAPLFYLNDRELKGMRDAAAQKRLEKFLYTDLRFETLADPVIKPGESDDDEVRYLVAVGLQLEIVKRAATDGHLNGRLSVRLPGAPEEFDSVIDLEEALLADRSRLRALKERVNAKVQRIPAQDRSGMLQQALARVQRLRADAQASDRPAVAAWWKEAERAIVARLTYGQYLVAV